MKDKIKWPAGNRLDLCIPLRKITVMEEGTQFGEYIPSQAAVVMVYLVGNYASYEYTPRIEDNKLFISDNGELKPGVYAIDVRIQEPERKLRSFRCGELEIVRETKQLALGDFVLDNNITLDADAFIFGEGPSAYEVAVRDGYTGTKEEWLESMRGKEGRGIADIVSLPTGAFRILLTDGSAYTTPILKGEQGVSISDISVTGITTMEVLCTVTMSDGTTHRLNLPRGEQGAKGDKGDDGQDGRGIQSIVLNGDYTLTFNYTDGTTFTTPQALRGEKGENGQDGQDGQDGRGISSMVIDDNNHLTVSYTDGTTYTTPQSLQGERGVSITDFEQVGESATMTFFNIYFSNGNISQIGLPKGEQGDRGETGPQGPKGDTVVLGEVGEYKLYNIGGTATDGAMTQDATTKAIAASNGYYECGTAAGTAAKVAVGDNEALYSLQKGGSIKVKMTAANAAASGVTLKIGSAAATPLYYNNEPVSASNTWEAGEVISVYFDGTRFMASDSQGGSGTTTGGRTCRTEVYECYYISALASTLGKIIYIGAYGYCVSDYIDIHGAVKISYPSLRGCGNVGVRNNKAGYVLYDSDKIPISGGATVTANSWTTGITEVNVPSNAHYIRFTTYFQTNCTYTLWKKYQALKGSDVVDNLEDGGTEVPLSAEQGKILNSKTAVDTIEMVAPIASSNYFINACQSSADFGKESSTSTSYVSASDFIECNSFSKIIFYGLRDSNTNSTKSRYYGGLVFYDEEKNPIQEGALITHTAQSGTFSAIQYEKQVPLNAFYFRYTLYTPYSNISAVLKEPNKNIIYKKDVVNNLSDGGTDVPLSAEQGKILQDMASYVDERDTSVFTGDTQEAAAATIENIDGEWVINKPGSIGYRGVGLFIGTIPSTREYTWEIEYSSTSTANTIIRFSTEINTQKASHISISSFIKKSSHRVATFKRARGNFIYLTVSTADMSDGSTITIHNIKVYYRQSVQEIGKIVDEGGNSGSGSDYSNVVSLYSERKPLIDNMVGASAFSCMLFSDLHGDTTNLSRILDLYDAWKEHFTCGINVGDTIKDTVDTGTQWYWNMIGDREFLFAIGNHDMWGGSGGYNNAIEQDEYDAWITPLVTKTTGLIRPENADANLLPYYYKDYGNIRVIVLSIYSNRSSSDLQWFKDALADAITNNKKVIAVNHIAHTLTNRKNSTASQNLANPLDYNNGFRSYSIGNSQQGYIDSPSVDTDNVGNGFVVAVKNFMNNGGTFITWISGHIHRDFFTDLSGTSHEATCGKQAFIALSTSRADYQGDNPKTWPDGTGMDGFYMLTVAEGLGVFKLMKFGAETDFAMRPRKCLVYNYLEHKMVASL